MTQDPLDHRRVFDTRDDLDRAAAVRAGFDVHLENSIEALRPAHCCVLLCRRTVLISRRLDRPGTSAPAGRRDLAGQWVPGTLLIQRAFEFNAKRPGHMASFSLRATRCKSQDLALFFLRLDSSGDGFIGSSHHDPELQSPRKTEGPLPSTGTEIVCFNICGLAIVS